MRISKGKMAAIVAAAAAAIVSTPLYWLLGGPDTGQLVAASLQGATGVFALAWALLTSPVAPEPVPRDVTDVVVKDGGSASASGGGTAISGALLRNGAVREPIWVEKSGHATAEGAQSTACSGIYLG
ncbi:hypothetical protein RKE29_01515 [Streptomyces sp. B1866]|uniref:hypothetical protein n=1 Tax=Streptomyces sp. B1866 TaxID=3075431 RepID=UPI00288CF402|nr:hypothetical protein [Streptomyces sp. B1866]MDT3395338.1 hypothetical protein [Streptomyces sp. B1866]